MSLYFYGGGVETIYEETHILEYNQFYHLQVLEDAYWNDIIREPSDQYLMWSDHPIKKPNDCCFSMIIQIFKN